MERRADIIVIIPRRYGGCVKIFRLARRFGVLSMDRDVELVGPVDTLAGVNPSGSIPVAVLASVPSITINPVDGNNITAHSRGASDRHVELRANVL
jgi:hypothetical protein